MSTPRTSLTRELVHTACLAPSLANTQPWAWRILAADEVELRADRTRQLVHADPVGRELTISCGAALDHFVVAAESFGLTADVEEFPVGAEPDLLARIRLGEGTLTDAGVERLAALENRRTDRRGSRSWPVPPERVLKLAREAGGNGVRVVVLTDAGDVHRVEQLVEAARQTELHDAVASAEQDAWVERGGRDGIPAVVAEPSDHLAPQRAPTRFERNRLTPPPAMERPDVLAVVTTEHDDPRAWLRSGRCLSAFWLGAAMGGLALTPTTQVLEVPRTRLQLRYDVLDGAHPQVLVRVGWPSTAALNPSARRTPRRTLQEVLGE